MRHMETLSATLSEISLPDSDGRRVRLGSLWADRPAIVVFLRHYG
jgi:prostamide/prostaglandin F2alpha synthase